MALSVQVAQDLLPRARALARAGHRVALLDSPPGNADARLAHLLVLDAPRKAAPDPRAESLCLATFDHGLDLLGIRSRHARAHGFGLLSFPVLARLTVDRVSGTVVERGEPALLPPANHTARTEGARPKVAAATATHDRESFSAMVRAAQRYIADGHTYQVNLSQRVSCGFDGDASVLFDRLRRANPSPYQALLLSDEISLVSASPELLLRTEGRELATRPIAGTRPRGRDRVQDLALERELVANAKERAEHAMLVDLARNDLGRVARYGTVRVADDAVVERYSHVMHLVSEVRAELARDRSGWDAFEAVFPCGTISGAPKKRSVEIIDELEPVPRGCYTGALGLLTPDASAWNILIRTIVLHDGEAHVQAGAGIVADSVPAREHDESLHKAQALLDALGVTAWTVSRS